MERYTSFMLVVMVEPSRFSSEKISVDDGDIFYEAKWHTKSWSQNFVAVEFMLESFWIQWGSMKYSIYLFREKTCIIAYDWKWLCILLFRWRGTFFKINVLYWKFESFSQNIEKVISVYLLNVIFPLF